MAYTPPLTERLPFYIPEFPWGYKLPNGEALQALVNLNHSVQTGIVATPAGTVNTAAPLSAAINVIGTAASGSAVILPDAAMGNRILIKNAGANAVRVFAPNFATINGTAGNVGILQEPGSFIWYVCDDPGNGSGNVAWEQITLAGWPGDDIAVTATGGTTPQTLAARFGQVLSVADFGATTAAANNAAAIQAAIDHMADTYGGGAVWFPPGVWLSGPLVLRSGVVLAAASYVSTLKLINGANADFIVSEDFASLTGSGAWLHSDGVPVGLGFSNIQIDANGDNQASGRAVVIYGKGLIFDGYVLIRDAADDIMYTECGYVAGQVNWQDLPEGKVSSVHLRTGGGKGWINRGPHDLQLTALFVNDTDDDLVSFETNGSTYNGTCDIGMMHVYASGARGVYANTAFRCGLLISESTDEEGVVLEGDACQLASVQLYTNCRTSGDFQFKIGAAATNHIISAMQIRDSGEGVSGLQVLGDFNTITNIDAYGQASTGTGIEVSGFANIVKGTVNAYTGAGGCALETGVAGQMAGCILELTLNNSKTLWNNASSGTLNHIRLTGVAQAGQTVKTGSAAVVNEIWLTTFYDTDTATNVQHSHLPELIVSKSGNPAQITNTQDTASAQVAIFEGDRATPAANDIAYHSYRLSDGAGVQTEFARMSWRALDVTDGSEDGQLFWSVVVGGVLTNLIRLQDGTMFPAAASMDLGAVGFEFDLAFSNYMVLTDGVTAPGTIAGHASLYIDVADGDLKIKFGDGTVKTIVVDT